VEAIVSFWDRRNVLVTGATGLLGSHLTAELLARGANPVCLVRDWIPDSAAASAGTRSKCRLVRGELADFELLLRAMNEYEIDSVFHHGAQTIVGTASRSALSTFESNIKGTWVLLEAARQLMPRIERVIVASSDKAYGAHDQLPYREDTPLIGRFPYDVSKSCADLISQSYYHSFRLPVAVTRCGNLYGGGARRASSTCSQIATLHPASMSRAIYESTVCTGTPHMATRRPLPTSRDVNTRSKRRDPVSASSANIS
jgi:CDP-glucose 4,6-dehydratase